MSAVSSPEMPPKLSDKRRLINLLQPHFVHFLFRISSNVQTLPSFLLLLLLFLSLFRHSAADMETGMVLFIIFFLYFIHVYTLLVILPLELSKTMYTYSYSLYSLIHVTYTFEGILLHMFLSFFFLLN